MSLSRFVTVGARLARRGTRRPPGLLAAARPLLAAALALSVAGCAKGADTPSGRDVALPAPAAVASRPASPAPAPLPEIPAPPLRFKEFRLPPLAEVCSYTRELVSFRQRGAKGGSIGLLDLGTGRSYTVLPRPVDAGRDWEAFRPVVSERWLAWEEVSANEGMEMRNAFWRLYVAPLKDGGTAIGTPRLVDEGWTGYKVRPQYGFVGGTLYWSETLLPNARREDVRLRGRVLGVGPGRGSKPRAVFENSAGILTLSVDGDALVVTEPGRQEEGAAARVRVIEPGASRIRLDVSLPAGTSLSHWPVFHAGWLLWASLGEGSTWPGLYCRDPSGAIRFLGDASLDPAASGDLVLFESNPSVKKAFGTAEGHHEIRGFDLGRRGWFHVLDTVEAGGWWQPVPPREATGAIVVFNDLGPSVTDTSKGATLVRVYEP
jgi:hypothetical protein